MKPIATKERTSRLYLDNPWWETGKVPISIGDLTPRDYLLPFSELVMQQQPRRSVVLMGPRRVGKTVLIHHLIAQLIGTVEVPPNNILYASVDTPVYTGVPLDNFVEFIMTSAILHSNQSCYFFFDEIQYLKNWETQLKSLVDTHPNIKFIVSGSAAAALRLKSTESGAGRFTDFLLPPLTFAEFLKFKKLENELLKPSILGTYAAKDINLLNANFVEYINYGGYPETVFSEEVRQDPARFIKGDILDKVLLKDLPSLYGINDVQELNRLFTTLAYNTGEEVSIGELTQSSGVNKETVRRYLDYLEAAFLIKRVRRIDRTGKHFQRDRQFKVYLTNPSLRTALFGPVSADHEDMGHLAETAIFAQWFHKQYLSDSINYARWKNGEIDFVGQVPGSPPSMRWATEVKWSDRPFTHPDAIKGILDFARMNNLEGIPKITTRTSTGQRTIKGTTVEFIPSSIYCYTIGKNIEGTDAF
ncbi:MAG: ATP-binding protein [Candidatus Neomarinimicrobiota bacterium]